MSNRKIVLVSVVAGVAITILTMLYNGTPYLLVGAVWYGFPLTWIRRLVVAPQYNPWAIDYAGLVIDLCFWTLVSGAIIFLAKRTQNKRGKAQKKRGKR